MNVLEAQEWGHKEVDEDKDSGGENVYAGHTVEGR
jgi:hypothetical protein